MTLRQHSGASASSPAGAAALPLGQGAEPVDVLRHRFLRTAMIATVVWGAVILSGSGLGLLAMDPPQGRNNVLFVGFNLVLLLALQRWPERAVPIGWAYLSGAFVLATSAQFLVSDDQFRMLLFFPLTGGAFLILGRRAGWLSIVAASVVLAVAMAQGAFAVSPLAVSSFLLSIGFCGLFFHVFERQARAALDLVAAQNAALDAAARQDPLTGLPNLRAFREAVIRPAGAPQATPEPFAVVFVDVDHFKSINDRFGHGGGDLVLAAVARSLRVPLRPGDMVARIGGEEFAVLLPATGLAAAAAVGERLRAAVAALQVDLGGVRVAVTVSVGVAVARHVGESVDAVLRDADVAMYRAKAEGRNRVMSGPPAPPAGAAAMPEVARAENPPPGV
ncbi:GGDEF domain-containing protein [Ancylobacter lacus]|uniref:GGDEF domain-containing protein n=1 Tax=Ancylobacter lacus TaxID=2579970 RepID=UPI001BCA8947|nr:GGDEF domain-containing protein [Ancylobacter lacus]MBS7538109.1 GGDEF domain-containing protein [Ancylobacter lacus]